MRSLKNLLQEKLENNDFRNAFEKESRLADLAIQIAKRRERKGYTQKQLATRAHLSQQQISKVERAGVSGLNLGTLMRVCDALDLQISLNPIEAVRTKPNIKASGPKSSLKKAAIVSEAKKHLGTHARAVKRPVHA